MDEEEKKAIGRAIGEHVARQGLGRENYCLKYGLKYSSLSKMITGNITDKALSRLESKVGISFRHTNSSYDRSSTDLGNYLRSEFKNYEGKYTLIRQSFETHNRICLFPVSVDWDDAKPGLRMNGQAAGGYEKIAHLSFPKGSPYLFVQANEKGWNSLMIFGTIDVDEYMKGALFTVGAIEGGIYAPFFLPILLRSEKGASGVFREIDTLHPDFGPLKLKLESVVLKKFVRTAPEIQTASR